MNIRYTVELYKPHAHLFKVTLDILSPAVKGQIVSLPTWIPGSYMIRDFSKNITTLRASSKGKTVKLNKIDKTTWQAEAGITSLKFEYEIYAWDLSVRSAHFDITHAFFNGTSLFLMPHGFENNECNVEILKPSNNKYAGWKVATSLSSKEVDNSLFGVYTAINYDDLIDHPVEIGTHNEFEFIINNINHKMALTGIHRADNNRLIQDLTKICQHHCDMFGELPSDINQYLFLTMVTGDGYGGLEHRSSTSLMCSRDDLPLIDHPKEPNDEYRNFLGLCSHEYFHTWNIKRIKPDAFVPYDLSSETYTQQLWAFEGITSYYDELALVRTRVISIESYLELIGQTITRVLRTKGRFNQTIAESSFDAWTKFYKQDESAPNHIVSYYAKGALLALCLDLTIRDKTNNKKSLDDVMRYLWVNHGKKSIGIKEGEIESIINKVTGLDLSPFFENYLYGVKELPLAECLSTVGIQLNLLPTLSVNDKGGKASSQQMTNTVSFGARFVEHASGVKVSHVFSDESAEVAGISAGDVIIAVNDLKVSTSHFQKQIESYPVGSILKVHAFRRDELMLFDVKLLEAEMTTCYLQVNSEANNDNRSSKEKWLFL
ncbi:MAG: PDZ domain-containing protein [Woeseiaceae bacterium]